MLRQPTPPYAVGKPRKVAKISGTRDLLDSGSVSGRGTGLACQPFFPRKAIMGALRTGKDSHRVVWLGRRGLRKRDLNPLVARASPMQARRCCLRLQSREAAGEQGQPAADATAG